MPRMARATSTMGGRARRNERLKLAERASVIGVRSGMAPPL